MITDLSRITRRNFQTKSFLSAGSQLQGPIPLSSNVQNVIACADNGLLNLSALRIAVNHIEPLKVSTSTINNSIVDPRNHINREIGIPTTTVINEIIEKPRLIEENFELPTTIQSNDDMEAKKTTILIRRRKMRVHKLKKLRKRMKFEWAKKRQRMLLKKEKEFQANLVAKIKEAEKFSAEDYINERLDKAQPLDLTKLKL